MFQTIWAGQPKPNNTKQKKSMMSLLYLFCVWFCLFSFLSFCDYFIFVFCLFSFYFYIFQTQTIWAGQPTPNNGFFKQKAG